ncbi:DedA family protein [Actinopolymorpha alba]|uniref:DedA family protein n=1 Tax=Actinopolymorpha alba TaxID=533267 RepID=UPI0012F65D81|nr:DedA family protein [Actinopolymorpha alba]
MAGTLTELHGMLMDLHPAVLVGLTLLAVALETSLFIGLVIPGDLVLLVAGTTATTPGRFVAILLAGLVGSLLGESIGYALGRRFGGRLRSSRLGQRLGEHRWVKAAETLERLGGRAILVARFVPFVHAMLPVIAGTMRYPFGRFIRWCTVAGVGWSALYAGAGALAGTQLDQIRGSLGLVGYAVVLGVGVLLAVKLVRLAVRRRRTAQRARGRPSPAATRLPPTRLPSPRGHRIDMRVAGSVVSSSVVGSSAIGMGGDR